MGHIVDGRKQILFHNMATGGHFGCPKKNQIFTQNAPPPPPQWPEAVT